MNTTRRLKSSYLYSLVIIISVLGSCTSLTGSSPNPAQTTFAGSGTIFSREEFTNLNMCNTLIQFDLASYLPATNAPIKGRILGPIGITSSPTRSCKILSADKAVSLKPNRNNFVSYVMGLSDQQCGVYKNELLRGKAENSTVLGSMATLFAGTAAIVNHTETAQAFAAAGAAALGINAVYIQERFANLALEVMTAGIDQRRKAMYQANVSKYGQSLLLYPVGMAVKDALEYHSACSAISGLEAAKDAITRVDDPGMKKVNEILGTVLDEDSDGVANALDPFPNNPNENLDSDGDGIGDISDIFPTNPDETLDSDKDGIGDNSDVFPVDPTETVDTDGDGVGNNSDAFPTNRMESLDSDGDGVGDNSDAFPLDVSEFLDSDRDGFGNNIDAFPNNPAETVDTDSDGVGDNGDAFPSNPSETVDSDDDGTGDNADAFPNDPSKTLASQADSTD